MTLIVPPNKPPTQKAWVEKDDVGTVLRHGVSPELIGPEAKGTVSYETLDACKSDNIVIDQAEALSIAHSLYSERWAGHDLARIYANKVAYVRDYRLSGGSTISSLLSNEANLRGISVEALVSLIESEAFADAALEAAELIRIAEKLAQP